MQLRFPFKTKWEKVREPLPQSQHGNMVSYSPDGIEGVQKHFASAMEYHEATSSDCELVNVMRTSHVIQNSKDMRPCVTYTILIKTQLGAYVFKFMGGCITRP